MWRTDASKMERGLLWLVACASLVAAFAARAELQLSISDPRPVARAIEVLSERHGLVITYEDPPYGFEGDVEDVTATVNRGGVQPGHRVLIPRGGSIEVTYSVSSASGKVEHADALIRKVLDTRFVTGGGPQFEVLQQGDVFHVVPVMIKNSAGAWVAAHSMLDTRITMALRSRSGLEMVDAICSALTAAAGVRVAIGVVPTSALANEQVIDGGTNESARDILSRSLKHVSMENEKKFGAERPYVWQLLFDPATRGYFLNLSLVTPQPELPSNSPEQTPPDPNAPDPTTARPSH